MHVGWLVIVLLCVVVEVGLLLWGRYVRSDVLRMLRVAVAIVLAGLATATAYQTYERGHATSSI
jgi:hypothetical protein